MELSPAYDLVNTTIALKTPAEELALPLRGKKNRFQAQDFFEYFGRERMNLTQKSIDRVVADFKKSFLKWEEMIGKSFLSEENKVAYSDLVNQRRRILSF